MTTDHSDLGVTDSIGRADLCATEQVLSGRGDGWLVPEALVEFGRPIVYEVDLGQFPPAFARLAATEPWRYLRVVIPFAIRASAARRDFIDVTIQTRLADTGIAAFDLEPPRPIGEGGLARVVTGRPIAVAVPPRPGENVIGTGVCVEPNGYGRHSFSWRLTSAAGGYLGGGSYVVGAVLQIPPGLASLPGDLTATATLRRPMLAKFQRVSVRTQHPVPFDATVPPAPSARTGDSGGPGSERAAGDQGGDQDAGGEAHAVRRLCVATDVKGYGTRTSNQQFALQQRFVEILKTTCDNANLDRGRWQTQGQGDGELAVLPCGIDETTTVAAFLKELPLALAQCNEDLHERARVRIRVAVHEGLVRRAANGFAGSAVVTVCRLLDSAELHDALDDNPETDAVLVVSDPIYDTIIKEEQPGLPSSHFTPVTIDMSGKHFSAHAWIAPLTPPRSGTRVRS